jgi:hypothetical protein
MSDLRRLAYTTVVGAGFSIDSQFHCFHAFFLIGMLAFEEERQLIARLKLAEAPAPQTDEATATYYSEG